MNFRYSTNSVKTSDIFFNKFLKTCFWSIFWSIFPIEAEKIFSRKSGCHTISYGFLAPCQYLEKTNDTIPRKCPDRRKGGRKATAGSPKYLIRIFFFEMRPLEEETLGNVFQAILACTFFVAIRILDSRADLSSISTLMLVTLKNCVRSNKKKKTTEDF